MAKRLGLALFAAFAVSLVVGLCFPANGYAQRGKKSAAPLIKKGQKFFDEQRYEESIQVLSAGLMRPGTAKKERIQIYKLLAYNYIVLQKDEEADGAVRGLLVIDEAFEPPDTESPRFRDFFTKVRKQWEKEGKPGKPSGDGPKKASNVTIKHASPAQVDPDMAVKLDGKMDDPDAKVARIDLYYRQGASGKFNKVKIKYAMRKFSVEIPGSAVQPPLVEYYLVALDDKGLPVAIRGDVEAPLRIAVQGETSSVASSPWLWVPLSLAVVAAVVIPVIVVTTSSSDSAVTVNVFE